MILGLLLAAAAAKAGVLTLDADRPVIAARVNGVILRLRVDLDQRDVVELNPAAADRTGLRFVAGFEADLGGVRLPGRQAQAMLDLDGRRLPVILSTHGRDCCGDADGAIGVQLLPYATVRFRRPGPATPPVRHPARIDGDDGLTVADGPVAVRLSLAEPVSVASKAAAVLLADAHGGRYAGPYAQVAGPFGVARPVRPVAFAGPVTLLGRPVATLLVRTGDFGGRRAMPEDRAMRGEIVVKGRRRTQRDWPVATLGRDLTASCTEIVFYAEPPTLDLACPAGAGP